MSLKLNRKGTVSYINNHAALSGRDLMDQHPMRSITGLLEELDKKYVMPDSGIPIEHLGFDAATLYDLELVKGYLQVQIANTDKGVSINANNIQAIQDFLNSVFQDGDTGNSKEPVIEFAYRDGFREEFIGEVGDTFFTLSNKYIADRAHLKVYRDGELLIEGVDYTETSDITFELIEPLEIPVFITCICESTSSVLSPIHEEIISTDGQSEFKLKNTYNVGDNSLSIFVDGKRLENNTHYKEIDMETVLFNEPFESGTKIILRQESLMACGKVLYQDTKYDQTTWHHVCIATKDQTVIDLPEAYIPGANMIMVHCGGLLQSIGEDLDYVEVNERQIRFNYPLDKGEEVRVTVTTGLYNWSEIFISLRGQRRLTLTHPYVTGRNDILVYESGILLSVGNDYTEVNSRTIEFVEAPYEGTSIVVYKRR